MPGRFPLLTDENIPGPLIEALRSAGTVSARAVFVGAFNELAAQEDDPFRYPAYYLKPKA